MNDAAARLGPIVLAPGVQRSHAIVLLAGSFATAIVGAYLPFAQPYILNEHLRLPAEAQGRLSGDLAFWTEVVVIALAGLAGAWSDRIGQRRVFALALAIVGVGYCLYPWAASVPQLYGCRLVYAVGAAGIGAMLVATQAAYASESSRGRLAAAISVISVLGTLIIVAFFAPLPQELVAEGIGRVEAGRIAYATVAAVAFAGALTVLVGLQPPRPQVLESGPLPARLRAGVAAARGNPRLALAYAAAFVGRADLIIVTIFLSLWVSQVGLRNGLTSGQALVEASTIFGVILLAALVSAPVLGWLADRIDRTLLLGLTTLIAGGGYSGLGMLATPYGTGAWPIAALLGTGQAGVILAATSLLGQQVPRGASGAAAGVFTLCGAVGILISTKTGGWLFDHWTPGGPFLAMGLANVIVALLSWAVWSRAGGLREDSA